MTPITRKWINFKVVVGGEEVEAPKLGGEWNYNMYDIGGWQRMIFSLHTISSWFITTTGAPLPLMIDNDRLIGFLAINQFILHHHLRPL